MAGVGVARAAAVLGRRSHADHVLVARRVGHAAEAAVADRRHDDDTVPVREAQRREDVRDLRRGDLAVPVVELEREVDDVGAVADRVADARRDVHAVAGAVAVEHPHGHDLRAVGEPGDADVVVRALADRAGDVRAVAVLVVREAVVVHEVVAVHEVVLAEVGRPAEALARGVGDARVQHRDHDALAAAPLDVDQVLPRVGRVHAHAGQEVPLQLLPAALGARGAGVVRHEGRDPGDLVGRRGGDLGERAQLAHRGGHALVVADRQHARARRERVWAPDAGRPLHGRHCAGVGAAPVAHDHLAGDLCRSRLRVRRERFGRRGRAGEHTDQRDGDDDNG